ncbi:MAG: DUF4129 domain-containing protein, partial [Steroidobacteraceae bacterium]
SGQTHGSWWARLRAWLRAIVQPPAARAEDGWLRRLIASLGLPRTVLELLTAGALALVAVLAGIIVVNELRAAGVLPSHRKVAAPAGAAPGARCEAAGSWADIEQATVAQQPRLLLELIVARLAAQERLPPARALTVRELLRAARLADGADRQRLAELAAACERVRFSARRPPPEALAAALQRGRELLAGLDAVRA